MEDAMACERSPSPEWSSKIDEYLDGELETADVAAVAAHLHECAACAADALGRVQMKRSVQLAGKRYTASAALREKISKNISVKPQREAGWFWRLLAVPAVLLLVLSVGVNLYMNRESGRR